MAWSIATLVTATPSLLASLGWVVYLIAITTLTGAAVSLVGLIMSAQTGTKAVLGLTVELVGLFLMLVGPFGYFAANALLSITGFWHFAAASFLPAMFFAYAMVAAIINRILIVAPKRYREGHDASKSR